MRSALPCPTYGGNGNSPCSSNNVSNGTRRSKRISRTPSAALPNNDCHDGFAYPWQLPPTTPEMLGAPVAQPLGPPLPLAVVMKYLSPVRLLQKPLDP